MVSGHFLFVTDANSRIVSIDLRTDKVISDVSTGGAPGLRADELAYDPEDGLLLPVNNADSPPFATLIKVDKGTGKLTVGKRITFTNATNGAEQPVWDAGTGKLLLTLSGHTDSVYDVAFSRDGQLIATYFFRDIKLNPTFKPGQFTAAAMKE